jgi:hypothetical protein
MKKNYIFHSACFDKELFRRHAIALNENSIDYQTNNKSNPSSARAPLSTYFEVEIYISEADFEKADQILKTINE